MEVVAKKKRRRLKNLQINEVSLVQNPAVPQALFCIVKRDGPPLSPETIAIAECLDSLSLQISNAAIGQKVLAKRLNSELVRAGLRPPTADDLAGDPRVTALVDRLATTLTNLVQRSAALRDKLGKVATSECD